MDANDVFKKGMTEAEREKAVAKGQLARIPARTLDGKFMRTGDGETYAVQNGGTIRRTDGKQRMSKKDRRKLKQQQEFDQTRDALLRRMDEINAARAAVQAEEVGEEGTVELLTNAQEDTGE